jgi:hypothetical protein
MQLLATAGDGGFISIPLLWMVLPAGFPGW